MHVPDPKSQISTTDLCTNGLAHDYPPTMIEVSIARKPGNARMTSRAPSRTVCRVCGKPWTESTQVVTLAGDTAHAQLRTEAKAARRPRPPEELVDALHDRITPTSGKLIASKSVRNPIELESVDGKVDES